MTEKTWTIDEEVVFARYEDAFPFSTDPLENCLLGRVRGTTAGGHRFMVVTPVTEALIADKGEAWVAAMLRDAARPPEGGPTAETDLVFEE